MGSSFSRLPISFSVVCAAISAAANPTPSITDIVPAVANNFFLAASLDTLAKVSGSIIISCVTFFAVFFVAKFFVTWLNAVLPTTLPAVLPTIPPTTPPSKFKGSTIAAPKFLAKPLT